MPKLDLNKELENIIAEGESILDAEMGDFKGGELKGLRHGYVSFSGLKSKEKTKEFFRKQIKSLPDLIKRTICLKGYPLIDEPEELKELAGKLTDLVIGIIPVGYEIIKGLLKSLIKKAALAILKHLAKMVENWCEGIGDEMAPLPLIV